MPTIGGFPMSLAQFSIDDGPITWTGCGSLPRMGFIGNDFSNREEATMKNTVLSIHGPEPKKAIRADRPPTEGFATRVGS
jgi:hypothetical protein